MNFVFKFKHHIETKENASFFRWLEKEVFYVCYEKGINLHIVFFEIIFNKIFPFFFEKDSNPYLFNVINRTVCMRRSVPDTN